MTEYLSYREEARRDRAERARLDRERDAARVNLRMAEKRAAADFKREQAEAKTQAREHARSARSARLSALLAWLTAHVTDLLFIPVILVPALLAWSAMAVYGAHLYGPAGWALPAFSEGAMWSFAAATTITQHRHPDRPVWHLRTGTLVFAVFGAALNFLHGFSTGGMTVGLVMALVSVAGVVAHQLVHAGPRRSRAERQQAKVERSASRRERRARRAALRGTVADMDSRGNARLVYTSGPARMTRRWGRTVLTPVERTPLMLPAVPVAAPSPVTDVSATVPASDDAVPATVRPVVTGRGISPQPEGRALLDVSAFVKTFDGLTDPRGESSTAPSVTAQSPASAATVPAVPGVLGMVPADKESAALAAATAAYMSGRPLTPNALQVRFGLTRTAAKRIVSQVTATDGFDVLAAATAEA